MIRKADEGGARPWHSLGSDGPRTLADRAFDALHRAIVTGELAPGERLPLEEIAASLGMSHLPVREAIRRLENTGLVEHEPHRGSRVTELSIQDLRELYEARLLLEPYIVQQAAALFTDADAKLAQSWLDQDLKAERLDDPAEAWAAHTEFHFTLYRACASTWLLHLVTPLWESSQRYRLSIPPLSGSRRRENARREHELLLAACAEHDGDKAARILHDHLLATAVLVAQHMGAELLFTTRGR